MSQFCSRCGALLREDGHCPNCDASYSVDGIFDQPQVYGYDNSYGDGSDGTDTPASSDITGETDAAIPYAEEVKEPAYAPQPADSGTGYDSYSGGYNGGSDGSYGNYGNYGNDNGYGNIGSAAQPAPAASTAPRKTAPNAGEMAKDWLDCAVTFFRDEPFAAADRVMKGDMYLWAIFASLNGVLGALCLAGMYGSGFTWLVEKVLGSYAVMLVSTTNGLTFGNLFGLFLFSLLMMAALFCATVGCGYGLLSINRKKPRLGALVRTVAIAFFPMTAACAGAYLLSFIMIRVAGLLLCVGVIASFRLFNELVRRENGDLPFWHTVLCNAAQLLAATLLVSFATTVI
ncbi:MAG: hypothetical protein IIY93_06975 [Clostridia bacterium]|nr:hypothetical protein [Clostridia bacterium]